MTTCEYLTAPRWIDTFIMTPQIIEQSASTPNQYTVPSGMMILLMKFEMIREIADTVRQDGDLDLRPPVSVSCWRYCSIIPVFASFVRAISLLHYWTMTLSVVCLRELSMATTPSSLGSCPCTKPIPTSFSFESLTHTVRRSPVNTHFSDRAHCTA